ncbi:unnamed protein product [Linum trigynum]|uniref:Uncharacterized protein n=1 Tax=Linum trigynum TaxID=586398 RepID=A0AAV2FAV1_9ROSI
MLCPKTPTKISFLYSSTAVACGAINDPHLRTFSATTLVTINQSQTLTCKINHALKEDRKEINVQICSNEEPLLKADKPTYEAKVNGKLAHSEVLTPPPKPPDEQPVSESRGGRTTNAATEGSKEGKAGERKDIEGKQHQIQSAEDIHNKSKKRAPETTTWRIHQAIIPFNTTPSLPIATSGRRKCTDKAHKEQSPLQPHKSYTQTGRE